MLIVTDHSAYDFDWVLRHTPLVVDTRNATAGCDAARLPDLQGMNPRRSGVTVMIPV